MLKKLIKSMLFRQMNIYLRFPRSKLVYEMTQQENLKAEQSDIQQHGEFENLIVQGLKSGGVHVCANKSHGKTRLLFSIAENLMKNESVRVIAFDGSETWLYSASRIPVFNISEKDILAVQKRTTEEIERYSLQNANLVKLALDTNKDILFRLKSRKPSKRGFFIRTVVNYLDSLQRAEKARTSEHENSKAIAYFLEEAQNAFNSRSTSSTETEEFLSVFCEARNNRESFFTASQRLTDFSKTIRAKQIYCLGKLNAEDITPFLRKLEKAHSIDFANMKSRTWFFEGQTFISPEFKQNQKPFIINSEIKQAWLNSLPKPKTLKERLHDWLHPQPQPHYQRATAYSEESEENIEESQGDGLMSEGDLFFPEEF